MGGGLTKASSFFSGSNLGLVQLNSGRRRYILRGNLDSIKGENMTKRNSENETASNVHELPAERDERLSSRTRSSDLVNQPNWSNAFTTFVVGVGIGALVALLFAPASGKKTRHYITRTAKQGLDDVASTGKRWSRRAQETVDDVKSSVAGVVEAGQKAYRTARDA